WAEGVDAALPAYEKAYALNPGDPDVLCVVAQAKAYAGEIAESRNILAEAFRLNPLPALWYREYRGLLDFIEGRYANALPDFLAFPQDAGFDAMYALACAGHLGDRAKIAECKSHFLAARQPDILLAAARAEPYRNLEPRQRLVAGLEKALAD